jgi:putative cell wall-binding protein
VSSETVSGGVVTLKVLTSSASTWTFGTAAVSKVTRVAGGDRDATAVAVSQAGFAAGAAGAVVLARDDTFPDALAGAPLAVANHGPILLTPPTTLAAVTQTELARVLPAGGRVYLLGGTTALSPAVAQAVAGLGYQVVRSAGSDRYATAVAVAGAVGAPSAVLLARGDDFPDALAAGAATGVAGRVIILTDGASLAPASAAYLQGHPGTPVYAIGGSAAQADPQATAVAGADRYATSVLVAQRFFAAPAAAGLATGANFPDALAAGPRLASLGAPLLLTDPNVLSPAVSAYLSAGKAQLARVEVYGGTAAVSTAVEQAASGALS